MPVPGFDSDFDHREKHTDSREKSLGALPVLLVAIHAVFEIRQRLDRNAELREELVKLAWQKPR